MSRIARTDGRRLTAVLVALLGLGVVFTTGRCGGDQVSPETLVRERCTECHTLAPIESAQKTHQEWESTVYRMIDKGARLNDQEAEAVIEYLSNTYGVENP